MAEAVFQNQVRQRSEAVQGKIVKIDSCGTGAYHVGDDPDERTVQTCKKVSERQRLSITGLWLGVKLTEWHFVLVAQGTYQFGSESFEQGGLSRVHAYSRHGPDEVSRLHPSHPHRTAFANMRLPDYPACGISTTSALPTLKPSSPSSPPLPPTLRSPRNRWIS